MNITGNPNNHEEIPSDNSWATGQQERRRMLPVSLMIAALVLFVLPGCGDVAGPGPDGNILENSGFSDEKGAARSFLGDTSRAPWNIRSKMTIYDWAAMGDGNSGYVGLKRCTCSGGTVRAGYITQDLRRPILSGRSYDLSFSGTLKMVYESGLTLESTSSRTPVRFVAYNGVPPEHPLRWEEKPETMEVIAQIDVTSTSWRPYRTRWRAKRDYTSIALFIGDSLVPDVRYPYQNDSLIIEYDDIVFIDNVVLQEKQGYGRISRNSMFD